MHLILIMTAATLTARAPSSPPTYFQTPAVPLSCSAVHTTTLLSNIANHQTRHTLIAGELPLAANYFRTPTQPIAAASFSMLESALAGSRQTNGRPDPNLNWILFQGFPQGFLVADGDSPRIIFPLDQTLQSEQAKTVLPMIQQAHATPAGDDWPTPGNRPKRLRYWMLSAEDYLVDFGVIPLDFDQGIPPLPNASRSEHDHTELIWNGNEFQLLIYKRVICRGRRCGGPLPAKLQAVIPLRVHAPLNAYHNWTLSPYPSSTRMPWYIEVAQGGRVWLRQESKNSPAGILAQTNHGPPFHRPNLSNKAPTSTQPCAAPHASQVALRSSKISDFPNP